MSARKTAVLRKHGQSAPRILVSVSLFIAVLATGWLIGRQFMLPSKPVPRGLVQIRCEQFELDNETGVMRPSGIAAQCDDIRTTSPSGSGVGAGPVGRLNGISEHFKAR
jgi:hypothetical protein